MRSITNILGTVLVATLAMACTGEIDDRVTTDFGDAVATSERTGDGDISTLLTTRDEASVLAAMDWFSDTGELVGEVADQPIQVDGVMRMDSLPIEDLHLLVYNLWDIEKQAPETATCVSNEAILCCRDASWSCRARF